MCSKEGNNIKVVDRFSICITGDHINVYLFNGFCFKSLILNRFYETETNMLSLKNEVSHTPE